MQSDMKKAFVFVLGMMLLTVGFTGCKYFKPVDGPGMERDSADIAEFIGSLTNRRLTRTVWTGILRQTQEMLIVLRAG